MRSLWRVAVWRVFNGLLRPLSDIQSVKLVRWEMCRDTVPVVAGILFFPVFWSIHGRYFARKNVHFWLDCSFLRTIKLEPASMCTIMHLHAYFVRLGDQCPNQSKLKPTKSVR